MNDVTVSLPLNMKRMVAMWLLFCGHLFAYLPPRPLGEALDVTGETLRLARDALCGEDGDKEIRRVARELQTFVRKQWQALEHRMRSDMEKFALQFRLPLPDVKFWLKGLGDDWAFLLYEDCGPVLERLLILEAMRDSTTEQICVRRHAVCAICGIELFPGQEYWRELRENQRRFKPPQHEPDDWNVHVVRTYSRGGKKRVSVCTTCKTRGPALPIPELDPIPPAVQAVPTAFRHYLSALTLWMKRDHGQGFAKVIGMTSCASRALNLKHQASTLGIFLSSIRPDELLHKNVVEGQRITGLLQSALRSLIDGGCLVLRHLFSMYELGLSSVAIVDKAELANDATGHVAPLLQRKEVGPAQIIMPDYDAAQEDPSVERMIGLQQNRPPLPSTETGSGNSSDGGVSVHIGVLSQDPKAAEALQDDKMDFAPMQDPYWLEKLFPWLFPRSRGGFAKPNKTWGWTIGQFTKWALLNHDHRFRNCAEFVFAILDRKFTEMIIGANANTGGMYRGTEEREPPTVGEANNFFQRFSWLPPSIPGSASYFKDKKRTLFAIRAYRKCEASVFVTMTFNPNWPEVVEMVQCNGGGSYWQYPGDCAIIFYTRLRQIMQYLWGDKSVFGGKGGVEDYWLRVEEQGRWGGLHVHILMWLSRAALANLANLVCATMPPCGHPLYEIVNQLHVHKHTDDYCGGPGKCRFGYSQPESVETIFHVRDLPPSKSVFLRPNNGKGSIQRVLYKRGPEDVNVVPYNPLLLARWQAQCNVEIVLQAGSKNKPAETLHNEELQDYAAAAPIYHYASKGDAPLTFKKLTETQKYSNFRVLTGMMAAYTAMGFPLAVSSRTSMYIPTGLCDRRRRKLLPKKLQPQDENAPAEFADGLIDKYMKRPLALRSLSFLHFCAWFEVEKVKKTGATKPAVTSRDDQDNDFGDAVGDKGKEEDDAVPAVVMAPKKGQADGDLLFPQKLELFGGSAGYAKATRSIWGSVETGFDFETCVLASVYSAGTTFTGAEGKLLFRLRKEFKLVSWVFSAPSEGEPFYHTFAMLAFPFWGEDLPTAQMRDAFPGSPTPFQSFCEQRFPEVFQPRTAVELAANLLALQRADGARAGATARKLAAATAAQVSAVAAAALDASGIDSAIAFAEALLDTTDEVQQKATTTLLQQLHWRRGAPSLNVDQIKVFRRVVDAVVAGEPLTMCTLGGGGTGKSLLIRHVVFELTVRHKKTVIIAATTGTAAAALGGMTMHAVFGFDIKLKADLQPSTSKWFQLGRFDLLICDECSMMSCQMFDAAATALRLVRGTEESEAPFGGASFWLLGDFKQLDAVDTQEDHTGAASAERRPAPFLFESPLFESFEVTFLTINERAQKDPLFAHLLDRLSRGQLDEFDRLILRRRVCASMITSDDPHWAATTAADAPHVISQSMTDARNFFFAGRVDGAALRLRADCRVVCHHGDFADCMGPLRPFAVLTGRKAVRDVVNNQALYYYPNGLPVAEGAAPLPDWRRIDAREYMAIDCALADFSQGVKPPAVDDGQQIAAMSKVSQYPRQLRLKPGMPVLIVRNYDLERQICNGSRAVFLNDSSNGESPNHGSTLLQIRLQHSGDVESLKRELDRSEKVKMVRSQYALIPAFAASVHKAQGISEDRILTSLGVARTPDGEVDETAASDMFAPAQAYVALSRSRTLRGVHLLAFDEAAIHVRQEVLEFYKSVDAPPTTPMYERTNHDGNDRLPFTTWRVKTRNFSAVAEAEEQGKDGRPPTKKRPRSAPSTPQGKGFSDDVLDENGVFDARLLKKRLEDPEKAKLPPPVRRLFRRDDIVPPSSSPPSPRQPLRRLLASLLDSEVRSDALTQQESECELTVEEVVALIEREEKLAQIAYDREFAEALQQFEEEERKHYRYVNNENPAEREALRLARKREREQPFRDGTHRNLAPTADLEVQAEIRARGGRLLNSLLLDEKKVFNFTVNAYCGVLRTFLMVGMVQRVTILGVDFVAYSRLDLDVIGSCQVLLNRFQYILRPTLMGGHFFLFCVFRYSAHRTRILGFDSLAGDRPGKCFAAGQFPRVIQYLGLPPNTPCIMHRCPQQPNGTDCGVFTLFNLRVMFNVLAEWHLTRHQEETFPIERLRPLNVHPHAPSSIAKTRVFRHHFFGELLEEALEHHDVFEPQLYIRD